MTSSNHTTTTRRDLFQEVTDKIVNALETGTAPWVRPWATVAGSGGLPHNPLSGTQYRGINPALLMMAEIGAGYSTSQWVTFCQAQEAGAQVRKGERGQLVVFWKMLDACADDSADADEISTNRPRFMLKHYTVFNLDQVDGLDRLKAPATVTPQTWTADQRAESLIDGTRADIRHGGNRAYFAPALDYIQLPSPQQFADGGNYYATALHELSHWTGHSSRLARDLTGRFGQHAYAAEELIAEMSAAYTCAALGIGGQLQHAEYIGSWVKILRTDKRAIFTAASAAQKACDLLLKHDPAESTPLAVAA